MLHRTEKQTGIYVSSQIINIQLAYICLLDMYFFMPDDGPWEGPKHVALLIQAIKNCYVQQQYIK